MKLLVLLYIIIINLIGFLIMGIDKRRAKHGMWRISEKTLFLVALLLGSPGVLAGMQVFRHKTKHLKFIIGIPLILILQLIIGGFLFTKYHAWMNSPAQTVSRELHSISDNSSQLFDQYVSSYDSINSLSTPDRLDDHTVQAVRLFFQNFKFKIQKEEIQDNQATVSVSLSNIDMKSLAEDICRSLTEESVQIYPDSPQISSDCFYEILIKHLSEQNYEKKEILSDFHLHLEQDGWILEKDHDFINSITGQFLTYLNDPHILSASEVLDMQLNSLKKLSVEQWKTYLGIKDIFSTENPVYTELIDQAYTQKLAASFDYKIIRCEENENSASAVVRIISLDMPGILDSYKKLLLRYASSSQSIRDNDESFQNETAALLLQAIESSQDTTSTDIALSFQNNGKIWDISFNQTFTEALMGDIAKAIKSFHSEQEVSSDQLIETRYH